VTRFHSAQDAEKALEDFQLRAKGGIPDNIPEMSFEGAPIGIAQLIKMAQLTTSTTEANRNIEQGGVKIDGIVITDKGLKVEAGTFVLQVGKRKFTKITLKK
jgi:tyrosyl-tRNA synthetase